MEKLKKQRKTFYCSLMSIPASSIGIILFEFLYQTVGCKLCVIPLTLFIGLFIISVLVFVGISIYFSLHK